MRQRLGVAASLLREPKLLVLDEPANGLDPAGIRDMRALVKRLAASGLTVLLSSHDMDEVEEICDNVTIMNRGTVAFHGTIAELRAMAPDPGHLLQHHRRRGAPSRSPGTTPRCASSAAADGADGALVVTGAAAAGLGVRRRRWCATDVALLGFTATRTPLEALFFMLTDDTDAPDAAGVRALHRAAGGTAMTTTETAPPVRTTAAEPARRRAGFGAALRWELRKLRAQTRASAPS